MAQLYKSDKKGNILDENGDIVLTIVPGKNCSYKFLKQAAATLANTLFMVERGQEYGKAMKKERANK